jgi:hypothetical protein
MAAERKPGSNRGPPGARLGQAFLSYAALPPEQRGYAAVAAEFGVSPRTVERHGRNEHWRERARELDREASRAAAVGLVEERVARLRNHDSEPSRAFRPTADARGGERGAIAPTRSDRRQNDRIGYDFVGPCRRRALDQPPIGGRHT